MLQDRAKVAEYPFDQSPNIIHLLNRSSYFPNALAEKIEKNAFRTFLQTHIFYTNLQFHTAHKKTQESTKLQYIKKEFFFVA